jgi:hypothetical protein
MRQLADLAVWAGMIAVAIGVVYFTPIVADYLTSDSRPLIVEVASGHGRAPTHQAQRPFQGPSSNN